MTAKARGRVLSVLAIAHAVREAHQELQQPLTGRILRRVLAKEGVDVMRAPITRARVYTLAGTFTIVVPSTLPPRDEWRHVLHEWAHIKLHFPEHGEFERQLAPCSVGDPRELEANLFGLLLVLGPDATPETPRVATLVARIIGEDIRRRTPAQLAFELPVRAPTTAPVAPSADPAREYERRLVRQASERVTATRTSWLTGPIITDHMTDDDARIKFYDEATGAARFTDRRGVRWWIYNYRVIAGPAGERRRERIADFMSLEVTHRLFVNAAGDQRVYQFANRRERRAYRAAHLDRQLAHARALVEKRNLARALLTRLRRSKP